MTLRERIARLFGREQRFNLGQYPQFMQDYYSQFGYAGSMYPLQINQSMSSWQKTEEISATLPNYMTALRRSPPAFAAQLVRASVLSMARFTFRSRPNSSTPRRAFGNADLRILEQPWTNATTGELIARMEWSAGLAGNAYVLRQPDRLRVLRPDWVAIIYGSNAEPDDPKGALDGDVVGYAYKNGGWSQGSRNQVTILLPEEVAHWSPLPDPMSPGLGMSWITPALRDIQADTQALEHKISYFTNGATPNLVVKGLPGVTPAQFDEWVAKIETNHKGSVNAFKTLYLTAGADATVIGSNLAELDLASITAHGETRVSYLSRVPAVILGITAGLKGSSLNAGNYAEARRNFADSWLYPTLRDLCAAVTPLVRMPGGAELWFDVDDIPLLREDAKDAAEIENVKQRTIVAYVNGGFTAESSVAAVQGQNISLLKHTGLVSVQLQPPGTVAAPSVPAEPAAPKVDATPAGEPKQASLRFEPHLHFPEGFVQTGETRVTFEEGAIQAGTTIEEGAIQATHSIEAGAFPIDARTTVEEGAFPIDASTTISEGAVDARTSFAEGAVQAGTTIEKGAFPVDARTTVAAGAVRSEHSITIPPAKPKTKEIRVKRADGTEATATIREEEE